MCPLCKFALLNSPEGRHLVHSINTGIVFLMVIPFLIVLALLVGLAWLRYGSFTGAIEAFGQFVPVKKYLKALGMGFAALAAFIFVINLLSVSHLRAKPAGVSAAIPRLGTVPEFSLVQQNGNFFSKKDLAGKIWIADFIFTRCTDECPLLSARMEQLQQALLHDKLVRFVSFSIDPNYDKPSVLIRYAKAFNAQPGRWYFLTGNEKKMDAVLNKGFHRPFAADPLESLSPQKPPDITHSTEFILVDSNGIIRGYYNGNDAGSVRLITRDISKLEKAAKIK